MGLHKIQEDYIKLLPCGRCGNAPRLYLRAVPFAESDTGAITYAGCPVCGQNGPEAISRDVAVAGWNAKEVQKAFSQSRNSHKISITFRREKSENF